MIEYSFAEIDDGLHWEVSMQFFTLKGPRARNIFYILPGAERSCDDKRDIDPGLRMRISRPDLREHINKKGVPTADTLHFKPGNGKAEQCKQC